MTKLYVKDIASLVQEEVINLKKYITPKQAAKLKISITQNIYDQLTGDSQSKESICLLNKCAKPYSHDLYRFIQPTRTDFSEKSKNEIFSALEIFYHLSPTAHINIVHNFLQDRVDVVYFSRFINSLKQPKRHEQK